MKCRALTFAVLVCCSAVVTDERGSALANEVQDAEAVAQQIRDTDEALRQLRQELAQAKQQKQQLQATLRESESRVDERQSRLQELGVQISAYSDRLDTLDRRLAAAEEGSRLRQRNLADLVRQSQRMEPASGLKILLQHNDPAQADRLAVYNRYLLKAQQRSIADQAAMVQQILAARETALKDRNWLAHLQNKASQQHRQLITLARENAQNLNSVDQEIGTKTNSVTRLKADQQRLQSLLDELDALQKAESGYFASGKGDYPFPVEGELDARFGDVKSLGRLQWQGLYIRTSSGLPVRAVADGEVMYSDWLQGYGMLVILDHGDNYMTLYGGNRDVKVSSGDWVESGATIATVGDSGGQSATGVYFEIRHNATALDPEDWLRG